MEDVSWGRGETREQTPERELAMAMAMEAKVDVRGRRR